MIPERYLGHIPASIVKELKEAMNDFLFGPKHKGSCKVAPVEGGGISPTHCHLCILTTRQRHLRLTAAVQAVDQKILKIK